MNERMKRQIETIFRQLSIQCKSNGMPLLISTKLTKLTKLTNTAIVRSPCSDWNQSESLHTCKSVLGSFEPSHNYVDSVFFCIWVWFELSERCEARLPFFARHSLFSVQTLCWLLLHFSSFFQIKPHLMSCSLDATRSKNISHPTTKIQLITPWKVILYNLYRSTKWNFNGKILSLDYHRMCYVS